MPFTLIKGRFVPEAGRPDGDSMRFRPYDDTPLYKLKRRGAAPKLSSRTGTIQLRFEGIDTMESKSALPYSKAATDSNLELCGVPEGVGEANGYILTNQIGPNGRPIAFVYLGDCEDRDGSQVYLDEARLKESINYQQLQRGHAYPLFYDTLFSDLRIVLSELVVETRRDRLGVWRDDVTMSGAKYSGPNSISTMKPLFPKLWRRLEKFSRDNDIEDNTDLSYFHEYLGSLREERVFIVSEAKTTGFDNVVKVEGDKVSLRYLPEDLIVISL